MRRTPLLLFTLVVLLAGCGSNGGSGTPVACLAPTAQYLKALAAAPGEVRLDGDTAISDCFSETQSAGDQAQVGQAVIQAATQLNSQARRNPSGAATVSLGYLDGAVHEGTPSSGGIHADLVRRLDSAARFGRGVGSAGAAFERAFGKGYAAGEATG